MSGNKCSHLCVKAFTFKRGKLTKSHYLITVRKYEEAGLWLHGGESHMLHTRWVEKALAGSMNGSCPLNPVPTSVRCQAPRVNTGTEKRQLLFTSRICFTYVITS